MRVKGWKSQNTNSNSNHFIKLNPIPLKKSKPISSSYPTFSTKLCRQFINPEITVRRHWKIHTTFICSLYSADDGDSWLYATVEDGASLNAPPCHPLTFKPYPFSIDFEKFETWDLTYFNHTDFPFDRLVLSPSRSKTARGDAMVVLYGGGRLFARHPLVAEDSPVKWVELSGEKFDDVIVIRGITYVVDRLGGLFEIDNYAKSRKLKLGKLVAERVFDGPGQEGFCNRLVKGRGNLYMVARMEEEVFTVYKLIRRYRSVTYWIEIEEFDEDVVALFVSKECGFCMGKFVGSEYENCIVFSEAGFPSYGDGDGGWEYDGEDEIMVFRLSDGSYGRVGGSVEFPEIDWSPPSCVLDGGSCSSSHPRSQSDGEPNEDDEALQSDLNDSNNKDDKELEGAESHSNSLDQEPEESSELDIQDQDDEDMSLQEDIPASLFTSVSAVEGEVTKTLLCMNGGNEAVLKVAVSSRENIALSGPRACTSTTKGCKSDSATAKFEGFDIRSDLVPALQKIWRNHGNIIENSTMRSSYIIARALESLAIIVQTLENNPIQSLSDCQAEYMSTTLSDLRCMCFKVNWLTSFVEKAVQLHESKALIDSLN